MTNAVCPFCQSPVQPGQGACVSCGAPLALAPAVPTRYLPPGHALQQGKFTVGRVLGEGGFGITYKGAHKDLQRTVAIKELFPSDLSAVRVGIHVAVPEAKRDDFRRARDSALKEARVIAGFQARGIVDVYDMFLENGTAYIVMEYLEGQTLEAWLEQTGRLPLDEVRRIAQELCDALAEVHARQWLHRDIKPANIILTPEGRAVLIDFGSARAFQEDRTQQHTRILTAQYAAPEQYSTEARFGRYTDVFCLGATLYHALMGAPPPQAIERLQNGSAPNWPAGDPDPLYAALQQALELRTEDRPSTMAAFRDLLRVRNAKVTAPTKPARSATRVPSRHSASVSPHNKDRAALEALYQATNGASWKRRANWLSNASLGAWEGITVDNAGRVIELNLSSNQLSGTLPTKLGQLARLQRLSLASNQLSGPIPMALGQLSQLQELNLASNQLSGSIPAELGQLSQLRWLYLGDNQLSGAIPAELGRSANLKVLRLGGNQLLSQNKDRAALEALYQATNGASWKRRANWLSNPSLGTWEGITVDNAGRVIELSLSSNQLSGPIPAALGQLGRLQGLVLSSNQLSGPIPAELGRLTQLQRLSLSSNQLSGPVPAELGRLSQLRFLYLNDNQLSETLPMALGQLGRLQRLHLSSNRLSGSIPAALGQLTQLQRLDLSSNQLSGAIPAELGQLIQLQRLDLSSNRLSGAIPTELNRLANLKIVRLEGNQLLPQNKDRAALEALYQATNGAFWKRRTNWLSNASLGTWYGITVDNTGRVIKLKLSSNRLSGRIPSVLGQLAQLQELDLSLNQLSGSIPAALGQLTQLQRLNLSFNQLSGSIPAALGQLDRLQGLVLSSNQLSGSIPSELNRLEKKNTPRIDLDDLNMFSVFTGLSGTEAARVLPELQEARFLPQEKIYAKGDQLAYLYCLQEGTVQLEREATESPRTVGPGSLLGLVSLMSQQPCPEHAFASTEVRLITLTRAAIQQLSRDSPRFGENLWRVATAEPAAPPAVTTSPVNPYIQPTPTPPEPTGGSPSSRQNEDFLPAEPVPSPPASRWKELATLSWVGKIRFLFTLLALLYLLAALAAFLLSQILPAEILETLSGFLPR